jgi:putative FmdB family regulatory protein
VPTYEYQCDNCDHHYEEFRSILSEHPTNCPMCGISFGDCFRQIYDQVGQVGIVYGDPKTIGQQAELNAKRLGKEKMELIKDEMRNRTPNFTGKLPKGAKLNKMQRKTPWWREGKLPGLKKLDKPLDVDKVKDVKKYIETGDK